ncbi:LysR family transcriptional regulator [Alcaligenaceae bacterium]|nr:LysR family transcriptional regulator [Alcaligenaceae bacterium]
MDRLSGILAFVRTAESQSFALAARTLDVTPSGIGKRISRLENDLGVRLLNRTTRRVSLTDDGSVFLEHCQRILADLDQVHSLITVRNTEPQGRLRISLPSVLGRVFVVPHLNQFLDQYQKLKLEISLSDRWVNLVEEEIDIALRVGVLDDSTLVARPLWQQQLITVAGPRYLQGRKLATVAELVSHRCLMFRWPKTGRERPWLFYMEGSTIEWRPRDFVTLDESQALVDAARANIGIVQVPSYMAEEAIKRKELVELFQDIRPRPIPINVVYASQHNVPLKIRVLIDFLTTLPGPNYTQRLATYDTKLP